MHVKSGLTIATIGALALVGLTGCSVSSESACAPSGDSSNAITVTGAASSEPTAVDFPTPLMSDATQVTVLDSGSGEQLTGDFGASVGLVLLDGTDPTQVLGSFGYSDSGHLLLTPSDWAAQWPGLATALSCAATGDRLAVAMSTADSTNVASGFGATGTASMVAVIDVFDVYPARATGADRSVDSLFPAVTLATDGQPGIATPSGDAPAETTVGVLKQGDGTVVESDSTAIVHYSGWLWDESATQFDTNWGSGELLAVNANGVIPGFWKALEGQQVGSQIIVAIPPEDGYGDTATGSIPAGSTLLFVIDILSVA